MSTDNYKCKTGFPVGDLNTGKILSSLTEKELKYATYLTLASYAGFPILADQVSRESRKILDFLLKFFTEIDRQDMEAAMEGKTSPLFYMIEYGAEFFGQGGNFYGYGDKKFIPMCTKEELIEITPEQAKELLKDCIEDLYDVHIKEQTRLGFYPKGVTTYYEPIDFTKEEAKGIDAILVKNNIKLETTKILRLENRYEVQLPSIEVDNVGKKIGEFNGKKVFVTKGRYSEILKKVVYWIELARQNCLNEEENKMLQCLIEHYKTGDCYQHIKYSEHWVRDASPAVETYNGFIETYRDPDGVRAEFESFVACVDKQNSKILHEFTQKSDIVLPLLPYPKEYERKVFNPPSYNAINILTFVCSGCPIGINIPNYDEIRLNVGFKNVSLINVMSSRVSFYKGYPFLCDEDSNLLCKMFYEVDSMATAIHELYGHGSGRIFQKEDVVRKNIPDIFNEGKFIDTYYEIGQTPSQTFGQIYSAYEECRAETTSVYLAFYDEIMDIFQVKKDKEYRDKFIYASIISMLHLGAKALAMYNVETKQWTQSHSCARFAILKAGIRWGKGSVRIEHVDNEKCQYEIHVDKEQLNNVQLSMEILLRYLNYFKSTNKSKEGVKFFEDLVEVDDFWLKVREETFKPQSSNPPEVYLGVKINKSKNEYQIIEPCHDTPTVLDSVLTSVNNIKISSEI